MGKNSDGSYTWESRTVEFLNGRGRLVYIMSCSVTGRMDSEGEVHYSVLFEEQTYVATRVGFGRYTVEVDDAAARRLNGKATQKEEAAGTQEGSS